MLGIMTKDLYQNFSIRKNKISIFCYYLVVLMSVMKENIFTLLFIAIMWIPFVIVPALLQVSSNRDSVSNYDNILLTMPVTKKEIITAKYVLGILFSLFNSCVLLICLLVYVYIFQTITLTQGIYLLLASFIFSLISIAINYLSLIVLGSKGVLVSLGMIATILIGYFVNPSFLNIEGFTKSILSLDSLTLFSIGITIVIVILVFSYICSILYYSKKEFN